jgi:hypothetical protein
VPPGTTDDAAAVVAPSTAASAAAAEGTPVDAAEAAAKKADASTSRRLAADDDDEFHAEHTPHVETIAIIMATATTTDGTPQEAVVVRRFVVRGALAGVFRRGFKGVVDGSVIILSTMMNQSCSSSFRLGLHLLQLWWRLASVRPDEDERAL